MKKMRTTGDYLINIIEFVDETLASIEFFDADEEVTPTEDEKCLIDTLKFVENELIYIVERLNKRNTTKRTLPNYMFRASEDNN